MTVVGVQEKKGNYQGNDYHNYLIHCLKDDGEAFGQVTEVLKVKAAKSKEVFGKTVDFADLDDYVGKEIQCHYDRYGSVSVINVIE